MQYSNPRTHAVIEDWPFGQYRTTATFYIETHPKRGERGVRVTRDPKTGRNNKPKALTFARQARIVDGADGKTYILETHHHGDGVSVMQSNMQFQHEVLYPGNPDYDAARALFGA